jgi:hypothetical protein
MPQRPEFDMNSATIAPVYGRVGVLESDASKDAIIGVYYDRAPEFQGLYVITVDGIKYFDVPAEQLGTVGLTGYVEFKSNGVPYLVRELDEEDGLWMSVYKTELPIPVLQQMLVTKGRSVISGLTGIEIPQSLPEFEAMYVYYDKKSDRLSTIIYMGSYGAFSRSDADWHEANLSLPELQNLVTEEVDPAKANALINLYDENFGITSLKEASKYTLKVKETKE